MEVNNLRARQFLLDPKCYKAAPENGVNISHR